MGTIEPTQVKLRDGATIDLRSGTAVDAAACLLYVAAIVKNGEGMIAAPEETPQDPAEVRNWIERLSKEPDQVLIIAEHESVLIGMLDFHIGGRKRISHRGTLAMSVLPEWRARGVGTALLDALFSWVKTRPNVRKVGLAVLASNAPAIRLYERYGFIEEGRRRGEVRNDDGSYVDDILMCCFVNGGLS